jgi:inorganic pyrophosphatase
VSNSPPSNGLVVKSFDIFFWLRPKSGNFHPGPSAHILAMSDRRNTPEMKSPLETLTAFDRESGNLNVVIETPKGCRNKYGFDFEFQCYRLKGVLPVGAVFPFDFGSIPGTLGEDGDPLDVLLLMDEPVFTGCLVGARVLGVIEAEQTEKGKTERNDRLIAVAAQSHTHASLKSLAKLETKLLDEIEHFFVSYNAARGKGFKPIGRKGPLAAKRLVEAHRKRREH